MDPETALELVGAGTSVDVYRRVLGPSLDVLGEGLANRSRQVMDNLGSILENAILKLGDSVTEEGSVPPRIMKSVIEEGAYFESEVAADYFGGVLASSRGQKTRDDRGATYSKLLSRLSTYQIRGHYYFYETLRLLYSGKNMNLGDPSARSRLRTAVSGLSFFRALRVSGSDPKGNVVKNHILTGLNQESLIEDHKYESDGGIMSGKDVFFGTDDHFGNVFGDSHDTLLFSPTVLGANLYLWAHGQGHLSSSEFLKEDTSLISSIEIPILLPVVSVNSKEEKKVLSDIEIDSVKIPA
jgi:hypothetical protein